MYLTTQLWSNLLCNFVRILSPGSPQGLSGKTTSNTNVALSPAEFDLCAGEPGDKASWLVEVYY